MEKLNFSRIQSPSSINLFKQCPRRYYYQYIQKLPTKPSIYLVRGNIAHSVLEDFFKINLGVLSPTNFDFELKIILQEMLSKRWNSSETKLGSLGLSDTDIQFYLDETKDMIQLWLLHLLRQIKDLVNNQKLTFYDAFRMLTPATEVYYKSNEVGVQGYIDAIFKQDGKVKIIDYKTSKSDHLSDAYKLQLAIYALLYLEKHNILPDQVGIHFLKFSEICLNVTPQMVEFAKRECIDIHQKTQTKTIIDYPKKITPLCKWSSGQCDFYNVCCKQ